MKRPLLFCSIALLVILPMHAQAWGTGAPYPPGSGRYGAEGVAPPPARWQIQQGLRIQRQRTADGYQVKIFTGGEDPASIQVRLEGRTLRISSSESQEEEQSDDRGGYRYFRFSSRFDRRLSLPPDADPASMQRSVKDNVITLTFSRRNPSGNRGQGPGYPQAPGGFGPGRGYGAPPGHWRGPAPAYPGSEPGSPPPAGGRPAPGRV